MGTSTNILCCVSTTVLGIKPFKRSRHQSSSSDPILFQAVGIPVKKSHEDKISRSSFAGLGPCQRTSYCETRSKLSDFAVRCNPQPESFLPFLHPSSDSWLISWLLGLIAIVPFITQRLLTFTKKVDMTAERVEKIADLVEEVSEDIEKVAEEIAEKLPEGGKLRQVANFVENLAKETAKDAQFVQDSMDKVEELGEEIESVIGGDHSKKTVNEEKVRKT